MNDLAAIANQLRTLADQLDPPQPDPLNDQDYAKNLLRAAGMREPALSRLSKSTPPDIIVAWLDHLERTGYPEEHMIGYLIKRLDAGDLPPTGPQGRNIADILPRRPRRLQPIQGA